MGYVPGATPVAAVPVPVVAALVPLLATPPQPTDTITASSTSTTRPIQNLRERRCLPATTIPSPRPGSQNANIPLCGARLAVLAAPIEIVSVVETGAEPSAMVLFAKLQLAPAGNPLHASDAVPVNVLDGLSVTVIVPDLPEATVSEAGAAVTFPVLAVTPPLEAPSTGVFPPPPEEV